MSNATSESSENFVTRHCPIGSNFDLAVDTAIKVAFAETGLTPNAVIVRSHTTHRKAIRLILVGVEQSIPIQVRDDLLVHEGEFVLDMSHGVLE